MNLFRKPPSCPAAAPRAPEQLLRDASPRPMASRPGDGPESTKADEMVRLMAERHKPRRRS